MKRFSLCLFYAFVVLFMVSACSDDDSGTDPNNNNNNNNNNGSYANTMTCTINGTQWTATNILSSNVQSTLNPVQITGTGPDGSNLTLFIADAKGTGSYTIDGQLVNVGGEFENIEIMNNKTGSINLSNLSDNGTKGSFSFSGTDTDGKQFVVTNGSFDVPF